MAKKAPRILIVDDDEEMQTLYDLYFHGEAFETGKALQGQDALDLLSKDSFDLIVLDMIMPVMDGEAFLRKMHQDKRIQNIPVIIASVNEKIPKDILEFSNVYASLKKPFSVSELIEKIRSALKISS